MDIAALLAEIRKLPRGDQIELAYLIWDENDEDPSVPELTEAKKRELDRRLADAKANPDDVVPWEEVKARAEARLRS
jgi:putative addiction module component (TIGR02574 family)